MTHAKKLLLIIMVFTAQACQRSSAVHITDERKGTILVQASEVISQLSELSARNGDLGISARFEEKVDSICDRNYSSRLLGMIAMGSAALAYPGNVNDARYDCVFEYAKERCIVLLSQRGDVDAAEALSDIHSVFMKDGGDSLIIKAAIATQSRLLKKSSADRAEE